MTKFQSITRDYLPKATFSPSSSFQLIFPTWIFLTHGHGLLSQHNKVSSHHPRLVHQDPQLSEPLIGANNFPPIYKAIIG